MWIKRKLPAARTIWVRRHGALFLAGLLCLAAGFLRPSLAQDVAANDAPQVLSAEDVTVVELFTSQGCSSCPPADAFLKELADRPDIVALSFHVDYWNSPSWSDPYSQRAFSQRQKAYQEALDASVIYTPQIVVQGQMAAPGGRRSDILNAIEATNSNNGPSIALSGRPGGHIRVDLTKAETAHATGTVYAAVFRAKATTRILGGENRGRTLSNVHVVESLTVVGSYDGQARSLEIDSRQFGATAESGVAVFLQLGRTGSIVAASQMIPGSDKTTLTMRTSGD